MTPEELQRIQRLLQYENELWKQNVRLVAGIDEAGRGPLAGPVVAAAVIFSQDPGISLIDDSKKLTAEIREELYEKIIQKSIDYGIGSAEVDEIDRINILQASYLAMQRAIDRLKQRPDFLLVDGRAYPDGRIPFKTIVDGDSLCFSIASASILAKVTRDRIMCDYHDMFPEYGFEHHKGYATPEHLDAIEKHGYCDIHRRSFHPKRFTNQLSLFNHGEEGQQNSG
ncbi:ribonuclease HII [candidate division KSB1 bacterium]|nr:ribonuclease HII [candidate division KSB1 bacterium]NIR68652.1 ribonuclease HII [candidate division KSB1 bacterium]NIS27141.1 ribonuclease HII [candidate division KSB1 bacterium]NIT74027.1 ribonuclease HII [candidate division KSB1 bacterium]NIU27893.1 ribonuclease HII [candidate division KSB1 bacterium]